jgi:hypothetical protein
VSRVISRKNIQLSEEDKQILTYIFDFSARYRSWERDKVVQN